MFGFGDLGGEHDDLVGPTVGVYERVISALDPDIPAALAHPLKLARHELAAVQLTPEALVLAAVCVVGWDEQAVMAPLDLTQAIAHGLQEILVGGDDRAVEFELDDCLRLGDGRHLTLQIDQSAG